MTDPTPIPVPHPTPPARKRRPWLILVIVLSALAFVFLAACGLVALAFLMPEISARSRPVDEQPQMEETWSFGHGATKVARIDIQGIIMQGDKASLFSLRPDPVEKTIRMIRVARNDPEVKAIILVIDSPGGGITACDIILNELRAFKQSAPDRKVVALLGDVAASGGYYVALASDSIVAHPTTITGSIGVLISALNLKGFGDKYGIKTVTVTSGENKDLLNPFKDVSEEQLKLLQETVDRLHSRFVMWVAKGRGLPEEDVRKVADGRILTADQALEKKLIDKIGFWDTAMEEACRLLRVDAVKVVRYKEAFSFASFLERVQSTHVSADTLFSQQTRLLYLWPF